MVDFFDTEIETFGQTLEQRDLLQEYDNIQELDSGQFATVYKGEKNQETYAIKAISKKKLKGQQQKYLFQEVFVLKSMKNENTVQLIDQAEFDDYVFIVMEFCEQNLKNYLNTKYGPLGMPEKDALEVFYQIMKGMVFLHTNNFIHRDIKLENILVKNQKIIKIADFGFSKQTITDNKQAQKGTYGGTLPYMVYLKIIIYFQNYNKAPEMLTGEDHNYKIDVWSLGIVLVQLLLGADQFPFEGRREHNFIVGIKNHYKNQQNSLINLEELFNPQNIKKTKEEHQITSSQEQINLIDERYKKLKNISKECIDLLQKMIVIDFNERIDSQEILEHRAFQQFSEAPQYMKTSKIVYNQRLEHEFSFHLQRCRFIKNVILLLKNQKPEIIGPLQTICYFLNKSQLYFSMILKQSCQNFRLRTDLFKIGLEWWDQFEKSQEYKYMYSALLADIQSCENELKNNKQNVLEEVVSIPQLKQRLDYIKQNMEIFVFNDQNQQFKICYRQINNIVVTNLSQQLIKQGQQQDIEFVKLNLKILTCSYINQMICDQQFISQVFCQYVKERPGDNQNNLGNFFDNYDSWINLNKSKTSLNTQQIHLQNCFAQKKQQQK